MTFNKKDKIKELKDDIKYLHKILKPLLDTNYDLLTNLIELEIELENLSNK